MKEQELIPHLFRTEFSKITTVLCKLFGLDYIEDAEDIAGETFAAALESWPHKGVPQNPVGWLYAVAKNKAINRLKRRQTFSQKVLKEAKQLHQGREQTGINFDLSEQNIADSQLRMLFAVCHPSIPEESQIGLALRVLCGFGIEEIANAFLTGKETINKRLYRARKTLRSEDISMEMPTEEEIEQRLDTVLATLYLLFNEGYYSESDNQVVRRELCLEAMRLAHMLTTSELTSRPATYALLALFCFHSSRFEARKNAMGEPVLYHDQDKSLWNKELIARGAYYLKHASTGNSISPYHLEAGIAWWYTIKEDKEEKWASILQLYNQLLHIKYSPVAALNRIYALSKVQGNEAAIAEAEALKMENNRYYFTLLGELYKGKDSNAALKKFRHALELAKTNADKQLIQAKITALQNKQNNA